MRTKPSSLDSWLQKTKTEDPHVVYKKELTTSSNMTDENRNPEAGGSHWLTLSTVKCNRNGSEVKVHDSSFTSVSFPVQQSICNIMRRGTPPKRSDVIKVLFTDVSWQPNPNDCGLYAIANAVCDALGIDTTTQGYVTSEMRQHLISCFEKNEISPFPAYERKSIYTRGLRFQSVLKVFCTCRMPVL